MGGDEFAAFLVESDQDAGGVFLDRLRRRINDLNESGELALPVPIAISAGMTRYPDDGQDAETLFAVADRRLYEAKRANAA
jgi:diguanylate cyclase (GGDEF)-like protein